MNGISHCSSVVARLAAKKSNLAFAIGLLLVSDAYAGPEGGEVKGGKGTITQAGSTTTIEQLTSRLAIDWQSFDLNELERVEFLQPSSSSIALNRILSNSATHIHGRVDANGQLMFINPNGVIFGKTSVINAGGILASGLSIDPEAFMNGDMTLRGLDNTDGVVINHGILNAATGGSVSLIGKHVNNMGFVKAELGSINFASGSEAVLTFGESGFVGVRVSEALVEDEIGVDPAIVNSGQVEAAGGHVLISASVSQDVFSQAVNHGDMDFSGAVVVHGRGSYTLGGGGDIALGGEISVAGDKAGSVVVLGENITANGRISANSSVSDSGGHVQLQSRADLVLRQNANIDANASNGTGGAVHLLGDRVGVLDATHVSASGRIGGGEVLAGGDERGENSDFQNATAVVFSAESSIKASATEVGNGGRVILYASDYLAAYGKLEAIGGFIETSAGLVDLSPHVNVGDNGYWLIDPFDIEISTASNNNVNAASPFQPSGPMSNLSITRLLTALSDGATVRVDTGVTLAGDVNGGNITISDVIDYGGSSNATLILNAHRNINIDNNILPSGGSSDSLNLQLNANWAPDGDTPFGTGGVIIGNNVTIDTNGGNFSASGVDFTNNGSIDISAANGGGNIDINMTGAVDLGQIALGVTDNNAEEARETRTFNVAGSSILAARNISYGNNGSGNDQTINLEFTANSGSIVFDDIEVNNGSGDNILNVTLNGSDTSDFIFQATDTSDDGGNLDGLRMFLTGGDFIVNGGRDFTILAAPGDDLVEIGTQGGAFQIGTSTRPILGDFNSAPLTGGVVDDSARFYTYISNGGASVTGNVDIFAAGDISLGSTLYSGNSGPFNYTGGDNFRFLANAGGDIVISSTGLAVDNFTGTGSNEFRFIAGNSILVNGGLDHDSNDFSDFYFDAGIGGFTLNAIFDSYGGNLSIVSQGNVDFSSSSTLDVRGIGRAGAVTIAAENDVNFLGPIFLGVFSGDFTGSATTPFSVEAENVLISGNINYGNEDRAGNHVSDFVVNARGNITFDGVFADNELDPADTRIGNDAFRITLAADTDLSGDDGDISFINGTALYTDGENFTITSARDVLVGNTSSTALLGPVGGEFSATNLTGGFLMFGESRLVPQVPNGRGEDNRAGNITIEADGNIALGFIDDSTFNWGESESAAAFSLSVTAGDTLTLTEDIEMDRLVGTSDGSPAANSFSFTAGNQIVVDGSLLQSRTSDTNSANIIFRTLNNPSPTDPSSPPGILINVPITTNRRDVDGNLTLDSAGEIWVGVSGVDADGVPNAFDNDVFLDVEGVTTLRAADNVFLTSTQNAFRNDVLINTSGVNGQVILQDSDRFFFGSSDIAGDLRINAVGGIEQSEVVLVGGVSEFMVTPDSNAANNTGIQLQNIGNNFTGAIAASSAGTDIQIAGANLILGRINANGVSGGAGGNISILSNADSIQLLDDVTSNGDTSAQAAGDIVLDANITIGEDTLATAVNILLSGRNITLGGDVNVDDTSANGTLDARVRLVGAGADGSVDLSAAGTIDADLLIEGNSGTNTLLGPGASTFWTLNGSGASNFGATAGATTVAFSGFETVTGGNLADNFSAAGAVVDISQVNGGGGNDIFNLAATTQLAVFGDGGTDQLYLTNTTGTYAWTITNSGDANRISGRLGAPGAGFNFSQVERIFGSNGGDDNFTIEAGASIGPGNSIDAREGLDALNIFAEGTYSIAFGGNPGGISGVEALAADASLNANNLYLVLANETLSATNTWTIIGENQGIIERPDGAATLQLGFSGFANVVGNNNNDNFIFNSSVPLLRSIDGAGGSNTLNAASAVGAANTRYYANASDITSDTTADVLHLANLTNIMVAGVNNTLDLIATSSSRAYRWLIDGTAIGAATGAGRLQTLNSGTAESELAFSGYTTLVGSAVNDTLNVIGADVDLAGNPLTTAWTLNEVNAGNVSYRLTGAIANTSINFTGMEDLEGGDAVADSFAFTANGSVDSIRAGNGSGIRDTADYQRVSLTDAIALGGDINAGRGIVIGAERIVARAAEAASNTIIGTDALRFWNINANNSGTVGDTIDGTGESIEFVNFGRLQGAGEDDVFNLVNAAARAVDIQGGGGSNTIAQSGTTSRRFRINGANAGLVSAVGSGSATIVNNFSGIQTLSGGSAGGNEFIIEASGDFNGSLIGGVGGADRLQVVADDGGQSTRWSIGSASDSFLRVGQSGRTNFSNMEILQGGSGVDVFTVDNALTTPIGYSINAFGSDDGDVLDVSSFVDSATNPVLLGLQFPQNGAVLSRGGTRLLTIQNVEVLRGNNQANLVFQASAVEGGVAAANSWQINGANSGTVSLTPSTGTRTIAFENIANLLGGNGQDDFVIDAGASLRGTLDGGADTDNSLTWLANNLSWRLSDDTDFAGGIREGTATSDATAFANIQSITGNNSTLIGPNLNNLWSVTQENRGVIQDDDMPGTRQLAFAGFSNLLGNAARDRFVIGANGSLTGGLQGTAASFTNNLDDSLDVRRGQGAEVIWQLNSGASTVEGILPSFARVETLLGSNANDRFNINATAALAGLTSINGGGNEALADNGMNADRIYWQSAGNGARFLLSDTAQTVSANGSSETPVAFTNVEVVYGGGGNVDEYFVGGGTVSQVRGQGGIDNVFIDAAARDDFTIRILGGGDTNENSLTAGNRDNSFVVGGSDLQANTLNYIDDANRGIVFENFGSLIGNDQTDSFLLRNGNLTNVDGGAGNDRLEVERAANAGGDTDWFITNPNAGNVENRIDNFANIENLVGGLGRDTFTFLASGRLSGHIDALDDPSDAANALYTNAGDIEQLNDVLDVSAFSQVVVEVGSAEATVGTLVDGTDDFVNINVNNFEEIIGRDTSPNSGENDQWIALATTNPTLWNQATENSGNVIERRTASDGSLEFIPGSRIEYENFGSAQDGDGDEELAGGGGFTGEFRLGAGLTTINLSGVIGLTVVDISERIRGVTGNGNTLLRILPEGDADASLNFNGTNEWQITDTNAGTFLSDVLVEDEPFGFAFTGVNQLQGGTGTDTFIFAGGSLSNAPVGAGTLYHAAINGNGGNDSIRVAASSLTPLSFGLSRLNPEAVAVSGDNRRPRSGTSPVFVAQSREDVIDLVRVANLDIESGAAAATLVSDAQGSFDWNFLSTANGTLSESGTGRELAFTGVSEVRGGAADDRFIIPVGLAFNYLLDGGLGSDTVDLRQQERVDVNLSSTGAQYESIERFIGNNIASEFRATDNTNIWTINGNNSGAVTGDGQTIAFEGFNVIRGGDLDDTFNWNSGNIRDGVFGGDGDDVLNVDLGFSDADNPLAGAVGALRFDGEAGALNRVQVSGGRDAQRFDFNYAISGAPNNAEYRLAYSLNGSSDPASTTSVAAVNVNDLQEDAFVETISVSNIANRADTLTLRNNTVALNDYLDLTTRNNRSVNIDAELQDSVIIDGILDFNQNFTVNNAAVRLANAASEIRAGNQVAFIGTGELGSSSQALRLDTGRLVLRSLRAAAFLENNGDIILSEMMNPGASVDLRASGSITSPAALSSLNAVRLQSEGDIRLSAANLLSGRLDLLAGNGTVVLNNAITQFGDVSARNMTLTARGRVTDEGSVQITEAFTVNGDAASDVVLDSASNNFGIVDATGIQSLRLRDAGLDGITVSGNVNGDFAISAAQSITAGAITGSAISLESDAASVTTQGVLTARNSVNLVGESVSVLGAVSVNESNTANAISIDSRSGDTRLQAGLNAGSNASGNASGNVSIAAAQLDQQAGATIFGRDVVLTTSGGQSLAANITASNALNLSSGAGLSVAPGSNARLQGQSINIVAEDSIAISNADAAEALSLNSRNGGVAWQGNVNAAQLTLSALNGAFDMAPNVSATLGAAEHTIEAASANLQGIFNSEGGMSFVVRDNLQLAGTGTSGGASFIIGGDVLMTSNAQWSSANDLNFDAQGSVQLAGLSAVDTLTLRSGRGITDVNGDAINISAASFTGRSENGFGAPTRAEAIETQVGVLDVTNDSVGIGIINDGDVTVNALVSNSDIFFLNRNGNVILENPNPQDYDRDPSITDNRDLSAVVNAGYLDGTVTLIVDGGSLRAQGTAGRERPEIVARTATVRTDMGFGLRARQIAIFVEDQMSIFGPGTRPRCAFGICPRQPLFTDQDLSDPEVLRSASDLLIGVEEVEDVNLAIFTNVRNYVTEEISLRMPKDQLYEDEEEDEEDFDRLD